MKKTILTLVAIMMMSVSFAQSFSFPKNADGVVEISETLKTSNNESTNFSKVKSWINSQGFSQMNVVQENTNKNLTYSLTKNTKTSYNPFAGQFVENLIFNINVTVEGGEVKYTINNMQIQEIYAGYGVKNKITTVDEMINTYEGVKTALNNAQMTGDKRLAKALKKDNKDILENTPETLQKASSELSKLRQSLKSMLGAQ